MSLFVCAETSDYVCWCQTCNCQLLFCVIVVSLGPLDLLEYIGQVEATIFSQSFLHYS